MKEIIFFITMCAFEQIEEGMKFFMDKKDNELMKKAREEFGTEVGEDSTKYGEFISSYFAWVSLPQQKEKAKEMENMTKNSKKR